MYVYIDVKYVSETGVRGGEGKGGVDNYLDFGGYVREPRVSVYCITIGTRKKLYPQVYKIFAYGLQQQLLVLNYMTHMINFIAGLPSEKVTYIYSYYQYVRIHRVLYVRLTVGLFT